MNEIYELKMQSLNSSQRNAVQFKFCSMQRYLLLLAGAGSGKTTVLSLKLLSEFFGGLSLNEMFCITFTVKAADEMKSRISNFLEAEGTDPGELQVSTFHSLAWKIMSTKVKGVYGYSLLGYANSPSLDDKRNSDYLSLDSLVHLAVKLLKSNEYFREFWQKKCKLLLVDEYQDVSPDQIEFCKTLTGNSGYLFAVGDDDQAVYHFRGAEPRSILDFSKDFPKNKLIKLEVNYRSHQQILDHANFLFKNKSSEFKKVLISGLTALDRGIKAPQMKWFSKDVDEVRSVFEKISKLISEGFFENEIVILARTNRMKEYFSYGLKQLGLKEKVSFYTIHAAKGLEWKVVFVVGLGQGLFPLERKSKLEEEEEIRLFYVAITRAKSFLHVSGAKNRIWQGKRQVYREGALPKLAGFSKLSRLIDLLWR